MCWGTDLGLGVCVELMGLHWGVCVWCKHRDLQCAQAQSMMSVGVQQWVCRQADTQGMGVQRAGLKDPCRCSSWLCSQCCPCLGAHSHFSKNSCQQRDEPGAVEKHF